MSNIYDRQIQSALRQIERRGQPATWEQVSASAPPDPDQPWLSGGTTKVENPVEMCFLPVDRETRKSIQYMTGSVVPSGTLLAYMGQTSFKPEIKDVVSREFDGDLITYTVKNFDVIAPNGTPILYIVELEE